MSVHGEYARALRGVIDALAGVDAPEADWYAAFASAEVDATRDLSTAAKAALSLLDALAQRLADPPLPAGDSVALDRLRTACEHLRAHCHAILGARAS